MMKLVNKGQDSIEPVAKRETLSNDDGLSKDKSVVKNHSVSGDESSQNKPNVSPQNVTEPSLYIERPLSRMVSDNKTIKKQNTTKTKKYNNKKKQKWIDYTI